MEQQQSHTVDVAPDGKTRSPLCCGDKRDEAAQGHLVLSGQSTPHVSNTCTSTVSVSPETSAGKLSLLNWQGYYRAYVVYKSGKMAHMHALGAVYGLKRRPMMHVDFLFLSFSVLYRFLCM